MPCAQIMKCVLPMVKKESNTVEALLFNSNYFRSKMLYKSTIFCFVLWLSFCFMGHSAFRVTTSKTYNMK